ncbi:MAG: hypothetical protein J0H84_20255 [Rhizobiales bacterium]|nr:hypothetical protein [Hyphomicrobiales bacterium]
MPKRLAELEARVSALETNKAAHLGPGPTTCVKCGAQMTVTDEVPDGHFAVFGHQRHKMKCDGCGHTTERKYIPGEGYR